LVDWFRDRGDISVGIRGSLRCLPPHGISVPGRIKGYAQIVLFGNPLIEPLLEEVVTHGGGSLHAEPVRLPGQPLTFGLDRSILVPEDSVQSLESLGIRVLRFESLRSHLRNVNEFRRPRPVGCRPYPPYGKWFGYVATTAVGYQAGRWQAINDWSKASLLVKTELEEDLAGRSSSHYYLHAGSGLIREISWDEALFTQYALDHLAGKSLSWVYRRSMGRLEVPGLVPRLHAQLLRTLCGSPDRSGYTWHYVADEHRVAALETVGATLGCAVKRT